MPFQPSYHFYLDPPSPHMSVNVSSWLPILETKMYMRLIDLCTSWLYIKCWEGILVRSNCILNPTIYIMVKGEYALVRYVILNVGPQSFSKKENLYLNLFNFFDPTPAHLEEVKRAVLIFLD